MRQWICSHRHFFYVRFFPILIDHQRFLASSRRVTATVLMVSIRMVTTTAASAAVVGLLLHVGRPHTAFAYLLHGRNFVGQLSVAQPQVFVSECFQLPEQLSEFFLKNKPSPYTFSGQTTRSYYFNDLKRLGWITKRSALQENPTVDKSNYLIRTSEDSRCCFD